MPVDTYAVGRLINPNTSHERQEILVSDGTIQDVRPALPDSGDPYPLAIPGFIDIHTHGGAGHDIMDDNRDRFSQIARFHLENGTTSFLGSTATAPLTDLDRVLTSARFAIAANAESAGRGEAATLLGIHVEGPWISPARAGAQNPSYMHAPEDDAAEFIRRYSDIIRMVTFS